MQKAAIGATALYLALGGAIAQPIGTSVNQPLSLDQQSKISEIITNRTPQPLNRINFSVAPDVIVPASVTILRLPPEAENVAPQLHGYSYIAVEELVAIVDTSSRKITNVMQRMRRQENNKSGQ
jgi:hypothetical protein